MTGKRSIEVTYYAILREQRGLSTERLETDAPTARALYETLQGEHGFSLGPDLLKAVINGAFTTWDAELSDGDEVVFIPPVAGG